MDQLLKFVEIMGPLSAGASLGEIARLKMETDERNGKQSAKGAYHTAFMEVVRLVDGIERAYNISMRCPERGDTDETALSDAAKSFVNDVRTFENALRSVVEGRRRVAVYISAIDAAIHYWIPEALKHSLFFEDPRFAAVDVRIVQRESWQVIRDVSTGVSHLGVGTGMKHEGVGGTRFLRRPHVVAFHRSLRKKFPESPVLLGHLAKIPVVCLHDYIAPIRAEWRLHTRGVYPRFITMNTLSQMMAWVGRGLGAALVPEDVVRWPGVETLPLNGPALNAEDYLYYPKGQTRLAALPKAAHVIKDLFLNYWNEQCPDASE